MLEGMSDRLFILASLVSLRIVDVKYRVSSLSIVLVVLQTHTYLHSQIGILQIGD